MDETYIRDKQMREKTYLLHFFKVEGGSGMPVMPVPLPRAASSDSVEINWILLLLLLGVMSDWLFLQQLRVMRMMI